MSAKKGMMFATTKPIASRTLVMPKWTKEALALVTCRVALETNSWAL